MPVATYPTLVLYNEYNQVFNDVSQLFWLLNNGTNLFGYVCCNKQLQAETNKLFILVSPVSGNGPKSGNIISGSIILFFTADSLESYWKISVCKN